RSCRRGEQPMTMPYDPTLRTNEAGPIDPLADRPVPAAGAQDVVPATERGQDPARATAMDYLETEPSRPLSGEEREAAENDRQPGERVYAPASERVPRPPIPG